MAEQYYPIAMSAEEAKATLHGAVRFNTGQSLTTSQQAQARMNIGAGSENTGFRILGYYDTLEDLQDALQIPPQAGDAYGIGTEAPYEIYVWDGTSNAWLDNGTIGTQTVIDDNDTTTHTTWSSQKIKQELDEIDLSALIDDLDTAADTTWSSDKISTELSGKATPADVAALVDDSTTSASKTWSSQEIAAEITESQSWALAGTSANSSQYVTYPETAKELLICATAGQNQDIAFSAFYTVAFLKDNNMSNVMVGGYWAGSSDHSVVNVNHNPVTRQISFRNCVVGSNVTQGTFYIYYR